MKNTDTETKKEEIVVIPRVPAISELRRRQFKVKVMHFRRYKQPVLGKKELAVSLKEFRETGGHIVELELNNTGGHTRVELRSPAGREFFGEAHCNEGDQFKKQWGRDIALSRAIEAFIAASLKPDSIYSEVVGIAALLGYTDEEVIKLFLSQKQKNKNLELIK